METKNERLTKLIEERNFKEALYILQGEFEHMNEKTPKEKSSLYLLEATIWEALMDSISEFDAISRGLSYDGTNYELFYMLGLLYTNINVNKAYLCMERALFFCDNDEDCRAIGNALEELKGMAGFEVRKVSIMILSYNDLELLKECIDAVERYNPKDSFELVVVDNDSSEAGVKEYLKERSSQADYVFKLILGKENLGFPKGCNLGAQNCESENDIFFLNNDAVLTLNSLFWLRMGLYENRNVGATSAFSNFASLQEVNASNFVSGESEGSRFWHKNMPYKDAIEIFERFASDKAVPYRDPYIKRFRLTGFAVLVSRAAINAVAPDLEVFDEFFSPGYFEDDDLGIRIARAGFDQYLCRNSFVYHNGGGGFTGHDNPIAKGRERFKGKWGFDVWDYSLPWFEASDIVKKCASEGDGYLRVLDLSCGLGSTLSYIKSLCPNVFTAGVCSTSFEAGIASRLVDEVVYGEVSTMKLPWSEHSFDVVLLNREDVSKSKAIQFLKTGGICIDSQSMD